MLIVRPRVADDVPAATAVSRLAFLTLRDVYRPSAAAVAEKADEEAVYATLVGECEGGVRATVEYRLDAEGLHVRGLAVAPAFRRRGFAREMIEELVDIARERDRRVLMLSTIRETGNVAVFERLGFHVVGEQVASWCESDRFDVLHETRMERTVS